MEEGQSVVSDLVLRLSAVEAERREAYEVFVKKLQNGGFVHILRDLLDAESGVLSVLRSSPGETWL